MYPLESRTYTSLSGRKLNFIWEYSTFVHSFHTLNWFFFQIVHSLEPLCQEAGSPRRGNLGANTVCRNYFRYMTYSFCVVMQIVANKRNNNTNVSEFLPNKTLLKSVFNIFLSKLFDCLGECQFFTTVYYEQWNYYQ